MFSTKIVKELDETSKVRKSKKEAEESEEDNVEENNESDDQSDDGAEETEETETVITEKKKQNKIKPKKQDKTKHSTKTIKHESKKTEKHVKPKKEVIKKSEIKSSVKKIELKPKHESKEEKIDTRKDSKAFVHAKKEIMENKEYLKNIGKGNIDTGEHIVASLLEKKWYRLKDLNENEVKILLRVGYKKSSNNVYDVNGRKDSIIGYVEGRESLQHLSYKYFFYEELKHYKPEMEHLCKNSHNEIDLVIERNGEKLAIEFEQNPDMDHKVLSKIVELESEFKMIFFCCRDRDKKRFDDLESPRLHVGTFRENLKKIHNYLKF